MNKIGEFRLTRFVILLINLWGMLIFFIGIAFFLDFLSQEENELFLGYINENHDGYILIATILCVIVIHEFFHVIPFRLFGGKARIGITWYAAYVADTSDRTYTPLQIAVIQLFPLVVFSSSMLLLLLFFPPYILYIGLGIIFNVSGAACDMVMAFFILIAFRDCRIKDEPYGFSIYKVPKAQS